MGDKMIYSWKEYCDIVSWISWIHRLDKKDDRKEFERTGRAVKYDMRSCSERPRNDHDQGVTDWDSFLTD